MKHGSSTDLPEGERTPFKGLSALCSLQLEEVKRAVAIIVVLVEQPLQKRRRKSWEIRVRR